LVGLLANSVREDVRQYSTDMHVYVDVLWLQKNFTDPQGLWVNTSAGSTLAGFMYIPSLTNNMSLYASLIVSFLVE
jgi:hypothetical protein